MIDLKYQNDIKNIYTEDYVREFRSIHGPNSPINQKYLMNQEKIKKFLRKDDKWLDACCGEAWHFTAIEEDYADCTGVDISSAQISAAQKNNPGHKFICTDIMNANFPGNYFNLITSFWGGYCYFNTREQIMKFFEKIISWTAIDGHVYVDILTPNLIRTFNDSAYSARTNSTVTFITDDRWSYEDCGGTHVMLSPPFEEIFKVFEGRFKDFYWDEFSSQLIAISKLD